MGVSAAILIVLAIACEAFGYWGLNTVDGKFTYDEMAGIVPFAAAVVGWIFAVIAVVLLWLKRCARKRSLAVR